MTTVLAGITGEALADWKYQSADAILVPYRPDIPNVFPEGFLVEQYVQLRDGRLLDTVFPEGEMDMNQFVSYAHNKPLQFLCVKEGPLWIPAGFGWLYDVTGVAGKRRVKGGFVFYRQFWGKQVVHDLGRLLMRWWFDELKCTVVYGTMLANNRLALNYAKKFGFRELCNLPGFFFKRGELLDGILTVAERADYEAALNGVTGGR